MRHRKANWIEKILLQRDKKKYIIYLYAFIIDDNGSW